MHRLTRFPVFLFCLYLLPNLSANERPNVLFIAVDDLRVELGCYGQDHVLSPNIDRLAEEGLLFERAYCQQTVCNPSRASLLTGLRPDTLRVWDLPTHFRDTVADVVTLPQHFKNNGFHTQCIGKIFHNWRQENWKGDPASWSVPSVLHYNSHGNDKAQVEGATPANTATGKWGAEARDVPDNAYFDGRVAETAVEALQELQKNQTPFFLAVGFWKPHTPFNAPKKYWDLYNPDDLPLPENLEPPVDIPEIALTKDRFHPEKERQFLREMHHGHCAAISYLDAQVGKVIDKLDLLGLRENTIIVFWSDHGLHLGEHGLRRKTTAFELDARVPLIIDAPGTTDSGRTDALVELIDLYPTLTDLCGIETPDKLAGESLAPILKDIETPGKNAVLTQTARPNYPRGKLPEIMGYSMRTDRYRYTEWRNFASGKIEARELYDHKTNSGETKNIAGRDEQKAIVEKLGARLDELVTTIPRDRAK